MLTLVALLYLLDPLSHMIDRPLIKRVQHQGGIIYTIFICVQYSLYLGSELLAVFLTYMDRLIRLEVTLLHERNLIGRVILLLF